MQLEIGKKYQTVSGQKVTITGEYEGYFTGISLSVCTAFSFVYTKRGTVVGCPCDNPMNIVYEYLEFLKPIFDKEEIEKEVNPNYNWIAKDKNGSWYLYTEKPVYSPLQNVWLSPHGKSIILPARLEPKYDGIAENSLTEF